MQSGMEGSRYSLEALLDAPAADGDLNRLRYLIERLPLLVSRIDKAVLDGDRPRLRTLAHDGKGLYSELGRAGEHFSQLYAMAISAGSSEIESMAETLRSEAARLGRVLNNLDEPVR